MAELFATSKPNISMHISNILKDKELDKNSVVKEYLTTASDGKKIQSRKQLEATRADEEDMQELLELEKELKRR